MGVSDRHISEANLAWVALRIRCCSLCSDLADCVHDQSIERLKIKTVLAPCLRSSGRGNGKQSGGE